MEDVSLYEPIQNGLERVNNGLKELVDLSAPHLGELLSHVLESGGKRVRPAITLLSANFHPHDDTVVETMATAIELLHIATLIHDDTIDDADIRRGKATVSTMWNRKAAVLLGDFVFASSATFVCDTGNIRVIRRFSETIMELSSGELLEMAATYSPGQSRTQYIDRIYNKTASLFTTASESGAVLSGALDSTTRLLREYGRNFGMAYQIIDDILDLKGTVDEIGKPIGNDLSQGILTLPSIIVMEKHPGPNPIKELFRNPGNQTALEEAVAFIQRTSAVEDALVVAEEYAQTALKCLDGLKPNSSRDSLEMMVHKMLCRRS